MFLEEKEMGNGGISEVSTNGEAHQSAKEIGWKS